MITIPDCFPIRDNNRKVFFYYIFIISYFEGTRKLYNETSIAQVYKLNENLIGISFPFKKEKNN